ncbi:DinB family protein [Deinococcus sp.]|uniref:DinB family protein n=1 Tax=Deinococcus sp. TaxID=47478 RepID=UPI0025F406A4|nr:DinB family protein [Deinococcus sp.]
MTGSLLRLLDVVQAALPRLRAINETQAARQPDPAIWSAKQILGHLIDSGANNHARFVLAGQQSGLSLPGYDQNLWAEVGDYQHRPWSELVALWAAYQTQLAHIIDNLTPEQRGHTLSIGGGESVTLAFVASDYTRHQLHHLGQVWERTRA